MHAGFFDAFARIVCAVYEDGTYGSNIGDLLRYMDLQEAAENPREGYYRTMRTCIIASVLRESAPPAKFCQVSQSREYFRTHSRNIFLTRGGSFGIAHRPGQRGDTVAVLRVGAMPFILRPVWEHFELVVAYVVLNWMKGLAIDMWKQNRIAQRSFTLV